MENVDLMERVFAAISIGDVELLEGCIGKITIDTVLEFERLYGESPLHLCVKMGGMSHVPVVRCLIESGLFDSACVDGDGRTMLECAYEGGDRELLEALIMVTTERMDDATACYSVLRHDSLKIFKTFLEMKQFKEEEEFQHLASALIQLSVKNVQLSEDLRIFTLWKLSDYGFRNLSGNWQGVKDPNEWKQNINIVQEYWEVIAKHHDTGMYADVDDQFLYRLHTIHNQLYFLKHKQFLAYLPMQEAIFCVAIFLSIYKNPSQFRVYRLMINKCLVIDFMRMISRQLALVKKYLERTELDLLDIVRDVETKDATAKSGLIEDLLAKIESSNLPNKEHVVKQLKERASTIGSSNKDSLIKDMMDKVKRIDKQWAENRMEELKALDKASKDHLIEQIGKRLRHVSHPQNVANRLMGDWKKGKATKPIVADIISGESFDLSHLIQQDRRTKRKLIKCFVATKQHYSLNKMLYYCEQMPGMEKRPLLAPYTFADIACMKRVIQVFGEAIKNTANSPNMPGKMLDAVHSIMSANFPEINKQLREVFSHSISLKKLLVGDSKEVQFCHTFCLNLRKVRTAFQLLYADAVANIRHSFYGLMTQCHSLEQLRSFALYVGEMKDLEERQFNCYKQVQVHFDQAKDTPLEIEREPVGQAPYFRSFHKQMQVKRNNVNDLREHFEENKPKSFETVRQTCLSGDNLCGIKRMLHWELKGWQNNFFRNVHPSWNNILEKFSHPKNNDDRLKQYTVLDVSSILGNGSIALDCAEEFDYGEHTRGLVKDLGVAVDTIGEEALLQLNKRLKPYYSNLFFVDNKWKLLESFCKEQKLPWNKEQTRELVKRDQAHLQKLYDDRREQLRKVLQESGLHTLDGLTKRMNDLSPAQLLAIEYIQLELCEMLYGVGYFGDSFHYMKHCIPMIQGKNYRNYLAHDSLSYNLLTNSSSMEKIVINAFVFANTEVKLFGSNGDKGVNLTFPSLNEMNQWVEIQKQLLEAFQAGDIERMHAVGQSGGEIKLTRFCVSRNPTYLAADFFHVSELVNPCRVDKRMVEYLNGYFASFQDRCNDSAFQLEAALKMRDFQAAFDRTIACGDRVIREELLDWPELMEHVRKTDLFVHLVAAVNRGNMLKKLIEHGNVLGVREMLPYFELLTVTEKRGPLGDAMFYCVRSITDMLLPRTTLVHPEIILLAIILHWNDIFIKFINKSEIDEGTFQVLLPATALAGNYTAGAYLLETPTFAHFIPAAFEESCLVAVRAGELKLLKHLLTRGPSEAVTSFAKNLHEAALRKRWDCAQILLEEDASIDTIFPDGLQDECCTFLLLVKHGQYNLLRNVTSINREIFRMQVPHPFTVAIWNGMASEKMIRTLQRLGFDWLDSSSILHTAIVTKNMSILATILKRVDVSLALQSATHHDHFQLALVVLYRWKMISYMEESIHEPSLSLAIQNRDKTMVEELLNWGRRARTLPDDAGVLGGIVFERESIYICSLKRCEEQTLWNTGESCAEMVIRMETCALLDDMRWQQFTVKAQAIPITFHVLTAEDEVLVPLSEEDATFTLNKPDSLLDCLKDFLVFVNRKLSHCAIIFASFSTATGMKHFWQIEQINCMYDILSSPEGRVDLTDTVNYRDMRGETPLHHCFPRDTLDLAKLLVENGANPLLADKTGYAAIHSSLVRTQDYAVGRYLFDESLSRDLRNEKGCSVLDLYTENDGDRLIHTAVKFGRLDIITRLLQHGANVSMVNSSGELAVNLAACYCQYNSHLVVGMLLEHDPSMIDSINAHGFTMMHHAATMNSIELLQVLLQYKPNLLPTNGRPSALVFAILRSHIECAKCILKYANENGIKGLTKIPGRDMVIHSLICNDKELTRGLLEYELQHTLAEVDERDVPRLMLIINFPLPKLKEEYLVQVLQLSGNTDESEDFLQELAELVKSITDKDKVDRRKSGVLGTGRVRANRFSRLIRPWIFFHFFNVLVRFFFESKSWV